MGATAARDDDPGTSATSETPRDSTTQSFAAIGDRCGACGTQLASDQLYCTNCGERRGKARFSLETTTAPAATTTTVTRKKQHRQRLSSSTALVAGVGTLLLAMGVGVLIGRTNDAKSSSGSPPAQIITIPGAGSSNNSAATGSSPSRTKTAKAKGKAKAAKAKTKTVDKQTAAKAQAAASKVLGSSKNLPPATVTTGQKGHGPGYQGGKFTGTFFGQ